MKSTLFCIASVFLISCITVNSSPLQPLSSRQDVAIPGYTYEGCYTEATNNARALTSNAYYDDEMTVEKCAVACAGFTLFGVEYYREVLLNTFAMILDADLFSAIAVTFLSQEVFRPLVPIAHSHALEILQSHAVAIGGSICTN